MTKKLIIQGIVSICFFLFLWWGLSQLSWTNWFHTEHFNKKKKEQLNRLIIKVHSGGRKEITSTEILPPLVSIRNRLCLANGIDTTLVHLHVFNSEEINAFALPMGHIIIYTGLLKECDNGDMLAGIMAHEIAHIELSHISKRFAREIMLVGLASILGENSGVLAGILRGLTSNAFNRGQEEDADNTAVSYLTKAGINPKPMGNFLEKLSKKDGIGNSIPEWASTHPQAGKRAAKILSGKDGGRTYTPAADSTLWETLQAEL